MCFELLAFCEKEKDFPIWKCVILLCIKERCRWANNQRRLIGRFFFCGRNFALRWTFIHISSCCVSQEILIVISELQHWLKLAAYQLGMAKCVLVLMELRHFTPQLCCNSELSSNIVCLQSDISKLSLLAQLQLLLSKKCVEN